MKQNKHQLEHLPTLLVQQIRLQWYKDCRGGNAAAQRNQYPRAMRLPKDFFSYYPFGLPTHFASIIQRPDGFQSDRDCRTIIPFTHFGAVLGFVALPAAYFAYLIPCILLYMILATSLKKAYVRHYGELL